MHSAFASERSRRLTESSSSVAPMVSHMHDYPAMEPRFTTVFDVATVNWLFTPALCHGIVHTLFVKKFQVAPRTKPRAGQIHAVGLLFLSFSASLCPSSHLSCPLSPSSLVGMPMAWNSVKPHPWNSHLETSRHDSADCWKKKEHVAASCLFVNFADLGPPVHSVCF